MTYASPSGLRFAGVSRFCIPGAQTRAGHPLARESSMPHDNPASSPLSRPSASTSARGHEPDGLTGVRTWLRRACPRIRCPQAKQPVVPEGRSRSRFRGLSPWRRLGSFDRGEGLGHGNAVRHRGLRLPGSSSERIRIDGELLDERVLRGTEAIESCRNRWQHAPVLRIPPFIGVEIGQPSGSEPGRTCSISNSRLGPRAMIGLAHSSIGSLSSPQ